MELRVRNVLRVCFAFLVTEQMDCIPAAMIGQEYVSSWEKGNDAEFWVGKLVCRMTGLPLLQE